MDKNMSVEKLGNLIFEIERYAKQLDYNLIIDFTLNRAWLRDPGAKVDKWDYFCVEDTWQQALESLFDKLAQCVTIRMETK